MTAAVGADIESICAKCGDVWHVVVAKVGDRIAKVQCKQCNGLHRYKPPPGTVAARVTARAPAPTAGKAEKPRATRARRVLEPPPPAVEPDLSRPVRRYSPAEDYRPGDRVTHATFGSGVVETASAGKIQVVFPGGRRILAAAKPASTLVRPGATYDE